MATISKELAEEVIRRDGYWEGDPRVTRVVKYKTPEGEECHAVIYGTEDQMRYHRSPWCRNVEVVWDAK